MKKKEVNRKEKFRSQSRRAIGLFLLRGVVLIGSSVLAAILGSLSINAFLAEPGYNSQSRTIAMRYNGTGPTLTFKFCDEAPWNFDKAKQNRISPELLSYMTYVIQPFEDYLAKLPEELNNLLKAEYYQRLAEVNYDLPKLFDLVTNVCEDYFDPTLGTTSGINCSETFTEPHYGIGGKCFPTTANAFPGMGNAFLDIRLPKSRYEPINDSIAGEGAVMYHGVLIHIFDTSNNFYVLNYEDLTELSLSFYSTLMIEKASTDRVDIQKYMVDTYNCSSLLYGEPLPGSRYCDVEDSSTMPESFWHLRSYVHFKSKCLLDCVSNQYKLEIKKNGINIDDDADHDVAMVYLAYKTLTEIQTTLAGKSLVDLIAAGGGILGLCFGASILSIVELIIFFSEKCLGHFK